MFYNTPKNLIFRGALSCNELRGSPEKLSTIGAETVENLWLFSLAVEKI